MHPGSSLTPTGRQQCSGEILVPLVTKEDLKQEPVVVPDSEGAKLQSFWSVRKNINRSCFLSKVLQPAKNGHFLEARFRHNNGVIIRYWSRRKNSLPPNGVRPSMDRYSIANGGIVRYPLATYFNGFEIFRWSIV